MKNMRLTERGAQLLGTNHADGTPRYWIGYYALAYVGNRETDSLDMAATSGELTNSGDNIYNIWQGDMLNGYAQANPEDTAAASLFGLTLYDKSIRTNYRYVYDAKANRNRLVAWKSESTGNGENTLERKGAAIYMGTDGTSGSELHGLIPAPLYYGGEPSNETVAIITPDPGVNVTADYRYYVGTRDGDEYGWKESSATQEHPIISPDDEALLNSISNFNKFHGTVSAEGYGVSSVSSCHNMSKATKLFPISYYNVVNDNGKKVAETQYADNSPARKPLASAIKFSIDLSPITADRGYTALNYEPGDNVDDQDTESNAVYETKYNSFKFNRIGIYAVQMTVHRYSTDSSTDECNLQKVQFEIDGDAEPILFAVADINDTIISDNPSSDEGGVAKFSLEFILNLGNTEFDEVERRTAVYYDLYERDATTWFKNQLLASASLSEAMTDLSLEVNAIKQQVGGSGKECCSQDLDLSRYALKNHTHDYLKNLVDGVDKAGSVRGIYTCEEGDGKDIVSLFGLTQSAPSGALKSCILHSISSWESGTTTTIPDSYVYCEGFLPTGGVPRTDCITTEQLVTIVKIMGVNWLLTNVVTDVDYKVPGDDNPHDPDHVYIWTAPDKYATVDVHTGDIVVDIPLNPGSTYMYQAIMVTDADAEDMFSDGYSVGVDSLALGETTAAAGDYSVVQGNLIYSNSDYATILGSNSVKCDNSPSMTIVGASGFDIKDSNTSIVFGDGIGISGSGNNRPIKLEKLHYSIVGGNFYESGANLMTNGITASVWLMQQTGVCDGYGANGAITGSVITGNAYFGGTGASSVTNSLVLRFGQHPGRRTYGNFDGSIMLGEGTSNYDHYWISGEELDRKVDVKHSIALEANLHDYLSTSERNYNEHLGTDVTAPSLANSIVAQANIHKPVGGSLILSNGGLEIGAFSVNEPVQSSHQYAGGNNSIISMDGSHVGGGIQYSLVIGGGTIPTESQSFIAIGNGIYAGNRYDDTVISLADFNAQVAEGTIKDGSYAILGDGNLTVWNENAGMYTTVALSGGTNSIYRGVVVTNKHPKYSARTSVVREMHYNNITTPTWSKTIDLGSTNNNRVNSGAWAEGISVGNGHKLGCPGKNISGILCVGNGNNGAYTNVHFVSMVGGDITLNDAGRAYAANGDIPVFPTVEDVHIFNSGCNLGLGSLDPYATNEFKDALVLLDNNYDPTVMGIFQHPVAYYSQPNDFSPTQTWAIDWNEPDNASAFMIDPYLFDNYKEAWAHCAETHNYTREQGIAFWESYSTSGGVHDPTDIDVHWGEVTQYAEAHQSESDTYRGNNPDLHDFTDPFKGKTRAEIRTMIGKPKVPMIYTGGIALAGYPTGTDDQNFSLIKLGHVSKPVAYIKSKPVSGWGGSTTNLLSPVSVTGTTDCPYAGMVLAIDGKQEIDGTMHLVLAKKAGGGTGKNIISLNGFDETLYPLLAEGVNEFDTPSGSDYVSDILEMLGAGMTPVIRFAINGASSDFYATLCEAGDGGYMFTTDISYRGHRYICVRYTSESTSTPGRIKVTVSSSDIDIRTGSIST
jgi:hypothetical protein